MKVYFKERTSISMEERIKTRNKILKPLIKLYGKPVLVHSTHDLRTFKQIILQGRIKTPKNHSSEKKCPYMEKILNIDNCIYYSLGFIYSTKYNFKYNFIFDLNYLKELEYFVRGISRAAYKRIADYMYTNDRSYLDKLSDKSLACKRVVDRYLNEEFRGKRIFFDFWEAEKEIFEWVMNYPHKKVIWKIIKGVKANSFMAYPYSVRHAKKNCMSATVPEVISHDEINLLTSKYFLGFYINGKVPRDIERILRNKFCGKIFFDGKRIRVMK